MTQPGELEVIARLGIPGVADVHSHFMPRVVMDKVWTYFDDASTNYGIDWPIEYREDEQARLAILRGLGVRSFTSMIYAHKPGMAAWLNQWAVQFAAEHSDCLHTSTFYPEDGVVDYVAEAIEAGTRVFKIHLQVGAFDPRHELLKPVWALIAQEQIPVVIHCGSGPVPGSFTGPGPTAELIAAHPDLSLVIAHMGAPEYGDFLELADRYENVRLDTTMAFTDFMNRLASFPEELMPKLQTAGERGDVLFGSDFPNIPYSYEHAAAAVTQLGLGDEFERQVFWGAAAALFGLEPRG